MLDYDTQADILKGNLLATGHIIKGNPLQRAMQSVEEAYVTRYMRQRSPLHFS